MSPITPSQSAMCRKFPYRRTPLEINRGGVGLLFIPFDCS